MGRNPNITSFEYFDEQPIAQTSEFDTVTYNWARVGGSVVISDQEEDENQGAAQIFKLMKAKVDVLEESIKEKFSEYLYASGAGTDPQGLGLLIPDDPTSGTVGNISRANETQWRTSAYDFNGNLDSTNIEEAFDDILMDVTLKGDKPDVILCVNKAYFINSKYLRLHILKHVNMKVKELVAPWTIDAHGRRVVWQGQWCLWKAFRTHAVLINS